MLVMSVLAEDTPATMRRILIFVIALIMVLFYLANAKADTPAPSSWTMPNATAIRHVSTLPSTQQSPNYMSNLNCQSITYRLVNHQEMLTGCFTPTAFGLFEVSTQTVIYNGTDEGLPLKAYSPNQILVPWQNAGNLIVLDVRNTGGAYVSLYTNPLRYLQDEYNTTGQLTAKKLIEPPEIQLKDNSGQRITVNVPTVSISDGGGWLVAETLTGNFVRINLASLDVMPLSQSFGSLGSPGLLMSHLAVSEDGKHVAIYNSLADSFKVYDLSNCSDRCPSYDYQPSIGEKINNLRFIRHVRFINNNLLSFEATTTSTANDGVYLLAPSPTIQSLTDYLALGDSYTSGEGAFNYGVGTDTEDNRCHLSINSYPSLLTKDIFSPGGGHSVACSGAVIQDIANESDSYVGQVRNVSNLAGLKTHGQQFLESVEINYLPGYVAQHRFVKRWQPKVVTVSIGGNDIGFGEIIKQCVVPRIGYIKDGQDCFNNYEDRGELLDLIDKTIPRWARLFKQLQKQSPMSTIYAIGYPEIADEEGICSLNVHLSKKEIGFSTELITYLNNSINKAANDASISYVDISKALMGHRLCETASHNVAVNGLTAGTDKYVLGSESYHPNALGHQLIEQAILDKTRNFNQKTAPFSSTEPSELLDVPRSNRPTINRQYDKLTDEIIYRWETPSLRIEGSQLRAFSNFEVRLDGSILGTGTTDEKGNIITNFQMWVGATDGLHILDVTGKTQTDEPLTLFQPIYVPKHDYDFDGDDHHNESDSCLWAVNSGVDTDNDGIDDVCDAFINTPPSAPGNSTSPDNSTDQTISSDTSSTPTIKSTTTVVRYFSSAINVSDLNQSSSQSSRLLSSSLKPKTINSQTVKGVSTVKPNKELPQLNSPIHNKPLVLAWIWIVYLIFILWATVLLVIWVLGKIYFRQKSPSISVFSS